jgi:hypothetical protein
VTISARLVDYRHPKVSTEVITQRTKRGTTAIDRLLPEINAAEIASEPLDRVMVRLGTTPADLRASEALRRPAIYGPNDPTATKRTPPWLQFLARFRNPLAIILLVASALSAATGDLTGFLIVVTIIALSTSLDFVLEFRAHNAVDALRHSVAVRAAVRRDGTIISVPMVTLLRISLSLSRSLLFTVVDQLQNHRRLILCPFSGHRGSRLVFKPRDALTRTLCKPVKIYPMIATFVCPEKVLAFFRQACERRACRRAGRRCCGPA